MTSLRDYQTAALDAVSAYWEHGGGNPLVEMATGTGKSVVIGTLARELIARFPDLRILSLVHVRELVQQNARALLSVWPQAPIGINSASLGRRDSHSQILFASIQSVFRRPALLGPRDLILIDEAHLVPLSGEGMYLKLLDGLRAMVPDLRVAGFTATPYRLGDGSLEGGLFDRIVYRYGIAEGIADGFLSPLVSKGTHARIDTSSVARRGGEFAPGALEAAADDDALTAAAVEEILDLGADRRSWLLFCCGVDHAHHVADAMRRRGIRCETITGQTHPGERERILRAFKSGELRAVSNANVLTTGFDHPGLDLIAMLRPTLSTSLYVQMLGRGTRTAPGKTDCLVLDFAGNVRTHGPVDAVEPPRNGKAGAEPGQALAKECPSCMTMIALAARECPTCGHEYPPPADKPKHEARADTAPVLSGAKPAETWVRVDHVGYARHEKAGSPPSLRVTYQCGLLQHREWWCFEHGGYAQEKAHFLWKQHARGQSGIPRDTMEAMRRTNELRRPTEIMVRKAGKYFEVAKRRFDPPDARALPLLESRETQAA